ncbi:MAG: hypothetical protein KF726_26995 [Anaerolineae bacterium]|nr:hypothetical protein [Anaerolineae bacterium]
MTKHTSRSDFRQSRFDSCGYFNSEGYSNNRAPQQTWYRILYPKQVGGGRLVYLSALTLRRPNNILSTPQPLTWDSVLPGITAALVDQFSQYDTPVIYVANGSLQLLVFKREDFVNGRE